MSTDSQQPSVSNAPLQVQSQPNSVDANPASQAVDANMVNSQTGLPVEDPSSPAVSVISDVKTKKSIMSQRKKWSLFVVFTLSFFIDVWAFSAFFVLVGPISEDLKVPFQTQSWVITSYATTFAAFLLFWGRVSDLYNAKYVFVGGFLMLGILNIIISFLPDQYSFFILRALAGIAGACLIPAAYRLLSVIFEPQELGKAFTLFGFSGIIANTTGSLVAGFIEYIPTSGQGAPWRWFFRIMAAIILPTAFGSMFWIPRQEPSDIKTKDKWKRLDIVGAFIMLAAIIMLILGLTLGASHGWGQAGFIAPFVLFFVLTPLFFIWEARLPEGYAILPNSTWKIPNFTVLIVLALYIYGWWSVNFLIFVEVYADVHHEKYIIAALRLLPQGIAGGVTTTVLTLFPKLVSKPKWTVVTGMVFSIVGMVLLTRGDQVGSDYWRYVFTGGVIGSAATMAVFTGANVCIATSVPSEMSGVAGAVLQVALQVGSAVALSVQAGLLTVNPGGVYNFANVQTSFYFEIGWGIVWLFGFVVWYRPRPPKTNAEKKAEEGEGEARNLAAPVREAVVLSVA